MKCQIVGKQCNNREDCLETGECNYGWWQWEHRDMMQKDDGFCIVPYEFNQFDNDDDITHWNYWFDSWQYCKDLRETLTQYEQ
jgi:hypothetical protein